MIEKNYKTDFLLVCTGHPGDISLPWKMIFTSGYYRMKTFVASFDGTTFTNCELGVDGRITVYMQNHGLPVGHLHCEMAFNKRVSGFFGNMKACVDMMDTGVDLTRGISDEGNVYVEYIADEPQGGNTSCETIILDLEQDAETLFCRIMETLGKCSYKGKVGDNYYSLDINMIANGYQVNYSTATTKNVIELLNKDGVYTKEEGFVQYAFGGVGEPSEGNIPNGGCDTVTLNLEDEAEALYNTLATKDGCKFIGKVDGIDYSLDVNRIENGFQINYTTATTKEIVQVKLVDGEYIKDEWYVQYGDD